jgi:hypothetical protein
LSSDAAAQDSLQRSRAGRPQAKRADRDWRGTHSAHRSPSGGPRSLGDCAPRTPRATDWPGRRSPRWRVAGGSWLRAEELLRGRAGASSQCVCRWLETAARFDR